MASQSGASAEASEMGPDRLTPQRFAERFQECWGTLWCIAAAVIAERSGAEDILQESAMVALGKLHQFDPATNFTAWMGRIVRFVALNHARRRRRAPVSSVDPQTMETAPLSNTPEHRAAARMAPINGRGQLVTGAEAFDDRVLAALRTLEETARACLLLRTVHDMPYREIALALDIAEGTAMSHVHRSRIAMRERLAGNQAFRSRSDAERLGTDGKGP